MTVKSSPKYRCLPSVLDRSSTCGSHATSKMGMPFPEKKKIELLYRYSREIEHSDENLKMIEKIIVGHKVPWLQ